MVFSASYASAYYNEAVTHHDPTWYVKRQAIFAAAGVVVMYLTSKLNYQNFRWMVHLRAGRRLRAADSGEGAPHRRHRRRRQPLDQAARLPQFQPSEVAKLGVILYFSARLAKRTTEKKRKFNHHTPKGRFLRLMDRIGLLELAPYMGVLLAILACWPSSPTCRA